MGCGVVVCVQFCERSGSGAEIWNQNYEGEVVVETWRESVPWSVHVPGRVDLRPSLQMKSGYCCYFYLCFCCGFCCCVEV